mgnify:CR=1
MLQPNRPGEHLEQIHFVSEWEMYLRKEHTAIRVQYVETSMAEEAH